MTTENEATKSARMSLRECIRRYARMKASNEALPAGMVWPERQLLWSLVHGLVCAHNNYDPDMDHWVRWACHFLRWCAMPGTAGDYPNEEAMLMLILGDEMPKSGRDLASGERDEDFDGGDEQTYALR